MAVQGVSFQQGCDHLMGLIGRLESENETATSRLCPCCGGGEFSTKLGGKIAAIQHQVESWRKERGDQEKERASTGETRVDTRLAAITEASKEIRNDLARIQDKLAILRKKGTALVHSDKLGPVREQLARLWEGPLPKDSTEAATQHPTAETIERTADLCVRYASQGIELGKLKICKFYIETYEILPFIDQVISYVPELAITLVLKKAMPQSYLKYYLINGDQEFSLSMGLLKTILSNWNFLFPSQQLMSTQSRHLPVYERGAINRIHYRNLIRAMENNGYPFQITPKGMALFQGTCQIEDLCNALAFCFSEITIPQVFELKDSENKPMLPAILECFPTWERSNLGQFFIFWGALVSADYLEEVGKSDPNLHKVLEKSLTIRQKVFDLFPQLPLSQRYNQCVKLSQQKEEPVQQQTPKLEEQKI